VANVKGAALAQEKPQRAAYDAARPEKKIKKKRKP
jgi:hypothetical protein